MGGQRMEIAGRGNAMAKPRVAVSSSEEEGGKMGDPLDVAQTEELAAPEAVTRDGELGSAESQQLEGVARAA
jgi:hypothetical protein